MPQLSKDLECGLARAHRGIEVAAFPVGEEHRGERLPARERIATVGRDAKCPLQRLERCGHVPFVGEQRSEVQQRDPGFRLDPGLVEPAQRFLEQPPRRAEIVRRRCYGAEATQRPALAERVGKLTEEVACG